MTADQEKLDRLHSDLADHNVDALREAAQGNELTAAVLNANAQVIVEHIHAVAKNMADEDGG